MPGEKSGICGVPSKECIRNEASRVRFIGAGNWDGVRCLGQGSISSLFKERSDPEDYDLLE